MSWKNKLENTRFSIKTGDGKVFNPLWKNGEKSRDFNYSKYEFINQEGSFVDRKKAQSSSYPLVFWFTGDDSVDDAEEFERSSLDSRQWTVTHPFYGVIKGQPIKLTRNDVNYGVTEITVDFWQSLDDNYPESSDSITDTVRSRSNSVNLLAARRYISNANPATSDIPDIKSSIEIISGRFQPDSESFNDYKRKTETALKNVDNIVSSTDIFINSAQLVLSSPATFNRSIRNKISSIKSSYSELKKLIDNRQSKHYFESQSATLITTLSDSAVNPIEGDYIIKNDIEFVNSELLSLYGDYLETVDSIQVENEDIENAFIPDIELQQNLVNLVTYTSRSLFILGFDARQERTYIVDKTTNLIVLTHRFLGLDDDDENIKIMKRINNIKLDEIYTIKSGRIITYFV